MEKKGKYTTTDIFTSLRKNSAWILFVVYITCRYLYFEKDNITYVSLIILSGLFFLIFYFSKNQNKIIQKISFILFSIVLIYYDSVFIPDAINHIRSTYLLLALSILFLLFKIKTSALKLLSILIAINLLFIIILFVTGEKNPSFTEKKLPENPVFNNASLAIENKKNIILILLDGYPSKRVLKNYYNINSGLDSILSNYQYQEFNTNYISSPLSITNILFGVEYEKNVKWFKNGQDEIKLFNDAFKNSNLEKLLKNYNVKWYSFLSSEEIRNYLGYYPWRINYFRSADRVLTKKILDKIGIHISENEYLHKKILNYNTTIFNNLKIELKNKSQNNFILIHYLTFHRYLPVETLYAYADSLLNKSIKLIPNDYSIIIFSDHGIRKDLVLDKDKNSGIFFTNNIDTAKVK